MNKRINKQKATQELLREEKALGMSMEIREIEGP